MLNAAAPSASTPDDIQHVCAILERIVAAACSSLRTQIAPDGRIDSKAFERHQHAAHGLAWLATYAKSVNQLADWAQRLAGQGSLSLAEDTILRIGIAEYTAQIFGGIPMSQTEFVRLTDFGLEAEQIAQFQDDTVRQVIAQGTSSELRARLARHLAEHGLDGIQTGDDETLAQIRTEMRRFADTEVAPHAHDWHRANAYIPMDIIRQLAELGVFGLTIPEEYGGLGLGKEAMVVVSEELSRGYIGVGSLGTRSEIAAELILTGGTEEQKQHWLPLIASGEILPTAVFTEPNTGSDLASLRTRARREGEVYHVHGNKTWITHPVRADLMTLLARTNPDEAGHRGLTMFLAEKPRGTDSDPFPASGMSGGEIEVLGYRGMKEFEISFDDFTIPAANVLGGIEGQGFRQLMQTFEAARIQTAARAVGVARNALELGLRYATERIQFGKHLIEFPRIADKIALSAVEIVLARQLTHYAAREKDGGRRCDLEAGMAKLLAARVAWASADNALQIHGGNGFALEYQISRVLCDARILSIFEGAAEIQAQVIARRLLEQKD